MFGVFITVSNCRSVSRRFSWSTNTPTASKGRLRVTPVCSHTSSNSSTTRVAVLPALPYGAGLRWRSSWWWMGMPRCNKKKKGTWPNGYKPSCNWGRVYPVITRVLWNPPSIWGPHTGKDQRTPAFAVSPALPHHAVSQPWSGCRREGSRVLKCFSKITLGSLDWSFQYNNTKAEIVAVCESRWYPVGLPLNSFHPTLPSASPGFGGLSLDSVMVPWIFNYGRFLGC